MSVKLQLVLVLLFALSQGQALTSKTLKQIIGPVETISRSFLCPIGSNGGRDTDLKVSMCEESGKTSKKNNIFEQMMRPLLSFAISSFISWPALPASADTATPTVVIGDLLKVKEDSELLKTTVRGPQPSATDNNNYLKVFFETSQKRMAAVESAATLVDPIDVDALKRSIFTFPDNSKFLGGIFGLFVFKVATQSKSDLRNKFEDQKDALKALSEENSANVAVLEQEKSTYSNLKIESNKLMGEVDSLSQQLAEKSKEVTDFKSTIEELRQLNNGGGPNSDLIEALQKESEGWKNKSEKLSSELKSMKVSDGSDAKVKEALAARKPSEDKLLQSLKSLLVRLDLLPEGIANMLLMSTVPDTLDGIINALPPAPVVAPIVLPPTFVHDPALEVTVAEMTKSIDALNTENAQLKDNVKALSQKLAAAAEAKPVVSAPAPVSKPVYAVAPTKPVSAYVASTDGVTVSQENVSLRKELAQNKEAFTRIQDDMQLKLHAAKSMTKELNSKLMLKEQELGAREMKLSTLLKSSESVNAELSNELDNTKRQLEKMLQKQAAMAEAILLAETVVEAPVKKKKVEKKTKKAVERLAAPSADDVAVLKAMKPYQLKAMTKEKLEATLVSLGIVADANAVSVSIMTKKGLVDLLENHLEDVSV